MLKLPLRLCSRVLVWLEWRDGLISFIHDYRHVRYVAVAADLVLAPRGRRR